MGIIKELVKRKILDKKEGAELEMEAKSSGKREEEIILEKNLLSEEELFSIRSEILKIPLKKVEPDEVSLDLLKTIPPETATYYQMVPLKRTNNLLEIGMVWPEDLETKEALKLLGRKMGVEFKIFLILPSNLKEILKKYETPKIEEVVEEIEKEIPVVKEKITVAEAEKISEEPPVVKAIDAILKYALEGGASDIHIEPSAKKTNIRFRILGNLYSSLFFPVKIHPAIVARIKILSNMRIDETRIPQDGRMSIMFEGRKIDLRVSTFPTVRGEKVAIRILDPLTGIKKLEELGLRGMNYELVKRNIEKPYGLILITGPTGSGKTTTLYAILQKLNREEVNIVTLEDPVEYLIEGINQSQIRPEIGYDFAKGLRHVLRQDPDVILVGEIRDEETAFLATHAALTGHLVLSTLHTNTSCGAIPRLLDLKVPAFLISSTLRLVVAQRLVRLLCPACKQEKKPSPEIRDFILGEIEKLPPRAKKELKIDPNFYLFEPKGCKKCFFKGFIGRIGIFEVLEMNEELSQLISKNPSEEKVKEVAKRQGMITMREDGILKALQGEVAIEDVLKETGE